MTDICQHSNGKADPKKDWIPWSLLTVHTRNDLTQYFSSGVKAARGTPDRYGVFRTKLNGKPFLTMGSWVPRCVLIGRGWYYAQRHDRIIVCIIRHLQKLLQERLKYQSFGKGLEILEAPKHTKSLPESGSAVLNMALRLCVSDVFSFRWHLYRHKHRECRKVVCKEC